MCILLLMNMETLKKSLKHDSTCTTMVGIDSVFFNTLKRRCWTCKVRQPWALFLCIYMYFRIYHFGSWIRITLLVVKKYEHLSCRWNGFHKFQHWSRRWTFFHILTGSQHRQDLYAIISRMFHIIYVPGTSGATRRNSRLNAEYSKANKHNVLAQNLD